MLPSSDLQACKRRVEHEQAIGFARMLYIMHEGETGAASRSSPERQTCKPFAFLQELLMEEAGLDVAALRRLSKCVLIQLFSLLHSHCSLLILRLEHVYTTTFSFAYGYGQISESEQPS